MKEEIIIDKETIIEQNKGKIVNDEEKEFQKEQNSSFETSQYESSPKKEEIFSEKSIIQITQNLLDKEEKIEEIKTISISTYILKYNRKEEELKEVAPDTRLQKSKNCRLQLDIKIIEKNVSSKNRKNPENFLVIYCHEIAAFYFDEIYERIYSLEELCKENRYFRIFGSNDDAKDAIDEFIKKNEKNPKKFFIEFKDKKLKIHMKFSFFDKEKEIIFNVPKKNLTNKEKNGLLPELLKEIQTKMYSLAEENKKLQIKNLTHSVDCNSINLDYSNEKKNKNDINENHINDFLNQAITIRNKKVKDKKNKNI